MTVFWKCASCTPAKISRVCVHMSVLVRLRVCMCVYMIVFEHKLDETRIKGTDTIKEIRVFFFKTLFSPKRGVYTLAIFEAVGSHSIYNLIFWIYWDSHDVIC
jgi:hypothetical protein